MASDKGFTLIELLITVAIIGILVAIAFPNFGLYHARAFNTKAESDLKNIRTELEAYFSDNRSYPY